MQKRRGTDKREIKRGKTKKNVLGGRGGLTIGKKRGGQQAVKSTSTLILNKGPRKVRGKHGHGKGVFPHTTTKKKGSRRWAGKLKKKKQKHGRRQCLPPNEKKNNQARLRSLWGAEKKKGGKSARPSKWGSTQEVVVSNQKTHGDQGKQWGGG